MKKTKRGMIPVTLRILPGQWQKIGYLAENRGVTKADVIRAVIRDAVQNVVPPRTLETREIRATPDELKAWDKVAVDMNTTVDLIVRKVMNKLAKH